MKRAVSVFLVTALLLTSLLCLPAGAETTTLLSHTFDDFDTLPEGFITLGGGYASANVSISSEQDHTTGSGKSIKLAGRKEEYHRIKFNNVITPEMLDKQITASFWVYVLEDTELLISAYSDTGTEYATTGFSYKKYPVKANAWTKLSLTFKPNTPIVTQIGVSQDFCTGPLAETFYLDDFEISSGEVISTQPQPTKTENKYTFDDLTSIEQAKIEGGGGAFASNFSLTDTAYYGISGKSILFSGRGYTYARAKFMNAFEGLPQEAGTTYNISMMVMVSDNSPVDAGQFTIGVIDFLGAAGNGKEYYFDENYRYTVKKGEWTKIELPYTHTGTEVYGVTLDQVPVPDIPHADVTVYELYIDDLTVTVSDTIPQKQPVLSAGELERIANLGVSVFIDGKRISFNGDQPPEIIEGRTLVPLRRIFEKLGVSVYWDDATQTITGKKGPDEIRLAIGDKTAYINGVATTLDVPAQLLNSRTMVPVRFIAESLGCTVDWDEAAQRVTITSSGKENVINIYADNVKQEIYGFGASANHNAWYLMQASEEMQQKTLKALHDPEEGIGLSIVRLEINPYTPNDASNFNPEFQFTINPAPGEWDLDADTHQIWYAQQALAINPEIDFLATPWSPPSWMKENQSVVGKTEAQNILSQAHYEDYAEYLARWAKHYQTDLGFDLRWLSIQNEPEGSTAYASCEYSPNSLMQVTKLVKEKFAAEGIPTLVGGPEASTQTSTNTFLKQWEAEDPSFIQNELDLILTHSYSYSDTTLDTTNLERFNLPLIQAERCEATSSKRTHSVETLLKYGNEIADHLNHNYNAWCYWYGIRLAENLGAQNAEALVDFSDEKKEIAFADEYYSLGHFSKFIRPGFFRVISYSGNPDISVVTAVNPETGKLVLVAVNNSKADEAIKINGLTAQAASAYRSAEGETLAGIGGIAIQNGTAHITLKAQSITTLVEQ